ncbi:MAG TPA: helix-turn-helix transcriptional regulator [Acidobacteriaceae bacterium]
MGQTQAWLAEKCEVSENAVSKWIRTGKISRKNAIKASGALGISLDQLLSLDVSFPSDDLDVEWRRLSPAVKAKLISMVHEIQGLSPPESTQKNARKTASGR